MGGRSTLGDLVFMLWDIPCVNIPSLIHSRWRMFGLWCVCLLKASVCQDFFAQDKSVIASSAGELTGALIIAPQTTGAVSIHRTTFSYSNTCASLPDVQAAAPIFNLLVVLLFWPLEQIYYLHRNLRMLKLHI